MNCNKKIIFYPLDDQNFAIYKALYLNKVDITGVSTQGSGYVGKPVGALVNREKPTDIIRGLEDIDFDKYNTVLLSASASYELNKEELEYICTNLKSSNLDVHYYGKDKNIIEMLRDNDISMHTSSLDNLITSRVKIAKKISVYNQFETEVPTVYVGGLIKSYDSLDIVLQLKYEFEKRGFICAVVSNNPDVKMIGGAGYPESFMGAETFPHEQIVDFNIWISELDFIMRPDIIFLDIPSGVMQLSNRTHNTYGIYLNMMHQTISADFLIITLPVDFMKKKIIKKMSDYLTRLLGRSPDLYHISNASHDIDSDVNLLKYKPLYIKEQLVNDIINEQIDEFSEFNIADVIYSNCKHNITDLLIETYRRDKNE